MKIFIIILLVLLTGIVIGWRFNNLYHKNKVLDKTFGVRLLWFLQDFHKDAGLWSEMDREEYEYLCNSAVNEIESEFKDINNWWYFQNMVKGCNTYTEFIEKKYDGKFVEFLHNIRKF